MDLLKADEPSAGGVGAGAVASLPDLPFAACDGAVFRSALVDHGAILLRGAINPNKLERFRAQFLDPAIAHYADYSDEQVLASAPEQWWSGANPMGFYRYQLRHGYISEGMLAQATGGAGSYYDLISDLRFHELIALAFPGHGFRRSCVAHCRRIKEAEPGPSWAPPEAMHCDLRYHRETLFGLNFWVPFAPSGAVHGAPGLEVVDAAFDRIPGYLQFDRGSPALFEAVRFERAAIAAAFGEDHLVHPALVPGDVLVLTNWTLHGTHLTPAMTRGRLSVEVRLAADDAVADELFLDRDARDRAD